MSFNSIQTSILNKKNDNDNISDAVHKTLIDSLLRKRQLSSYLRHRNIIQLFGVLRSLSRRNLYRVMKYTHDGALIYLLQKKENLIFIQMYLFIMLNK
ncbi:unnamed protein product [Rotaria sp. Silwood2]|nr:unnamed protein product [Rotaria sp. Silwood2]CAF4040668.1 unnamed protein product [Rotaria sp. Silwood2]